MISAKEALELTKSRSQKVKEEKLAFVESTIRQAAEQELTSTKFTFTQLKPFSALVIENLIEQEFTVTQTGVFILVSWGPKKAEATKAVAKAPVKEEEELEDTEIYDDEDVEDEDSDDLWNT